MSKLVRRSVSGLREMATCAKADNVVRTEAWMYAVDGTHEVLRDLRIGPHGYISGVPEFVTDAKADEGGPDLSVCPPGFQNEGFDERRGPA